MEKLKLKYVDRNSILESQIRSVIGFDVDMSQWTQSMTTSDTKIEHLVSTMEMCETCQFVLIKSCTAGWC